MDTAVPYASMALNTVLLLAPEYGEAAMKQDESLASISMGLKAVPGVAHTASSIAAKSRYGFTIWCFTIWAGVLPFG